MISVVDRLPYDLAYVGKTNVLPWHKADPARRYRTLWSSEEYADILFIFQGPDELLCLPSSFIGERVFVLRNYETENVARLAQIHDIPIRWQDMDVYKVSLGRAKRDNDIAHCSLTDALYQMLVLKYHSAKQYKPMTKGVPIYVGAHSYAQALVSLDQRLSVLRQQRNCQILETTVFPFRASLAQWVPVGSRFIGMALIT